MSMIGKQIEEFTANAYNSGNGEFIEVTQENFKGKWSVVCFYPADFTFVCPTELEDLQNQYETLKGLDTEVYSVSTDTHFTHKAWHDHSDAISSLRYIMVGDPSQKISRNFDVLDEEAGLAQRGTFIIDPDGVVQAAEINADGIGRDASVLVNKIKAAQYVRNNPGEVCPAKWQEVSETLKPSLDLVGKFKETVYMLDANIKAQLAQYLEMMEKEVQLKISAGSGKVAQDMQELVDELASMSSLIKVEKAELERTPSFSINRPGEDTGIVFAGIPLVTNSPHSCLALLHVSGRAPKVDDQVIEQVKNIEGTHHFESYISLSCQNCPEVVQALNIMSVLNPNITHTMIDGAAFKDEVESKNIMAVPTVYLNGEPFTSGRKTIEEILAEMGSGTAMHPTSKTKTHLTCSLSVAGLPAQAQQSTLPAKGFAQASSLIVSVAKSWIPQQLRTSSASIARKDRNLRQALKNT